MPAVIGGLGTCGGHLARHAVIPILHLDDQIVVVSKPAGLLVHRSTLDRHETRFLVQSLRDQIGRSVTPVHRLDRPTSGVMVLAFDGDTCATLSDAFERGLVEKQYVAIVRGEIPTGGFVDHPLRRLRDDPGDLPGAPDVSDAAQTRYRRLATAELPYRIDRYPTTRYSLVALQPLTGRRHQLRRHLKHLSHPIIGDTTYGKSSHNRFFEEQFGSHRLLLSATRLCFPHPADGRRMAVEAPLPEDFRKVVEALGWEAPQGCVAFTTTTSGTLGISVPDDAYAATIPAANLG
jgi:tRNA pseudouridine65 synthase